MNKLIKFIQIYVILFLFDDNTIYFINDNIVSQFGQFEFVIINSIQTQIN